MPRAKAFSGKAKKAQLQEKRVRKAEKRQKWEEHIERTTRFDPTGDGLPPPPVLIVEEARTEGTTTREGKVVKSSKRSVFRKETKEEVEDRKYAAQIGYPERKTSRAVAFADWWTWEVGTVHAGEGPRPTPQWISLPKRPPWSHGDTEGAINAAEERYFQRYVRRLDVLSQSQRLNLFERNLEVWRELWRVAESSHVVAMIADARHPLYHLPPSLVHYITDVLKKPAFIVLNKVDLIPEAVLQQWEDLLGQWYPGIPVLHFTCKPNEGTVFLAGGDADGGAEDASQPAAAIRKDMQWRKKRDRQTKTAMHYLGEAAGRCGGQHTESSDGEQSEMLLTPREYRHDRPRQGGRCGGKKPRHHRRRQGRKGGGSSSNAAQSDEEDETTHEELFSLQHGGSALLAASDAGSTANTAEDEEEEEEDDDDLSTVSAEVPQYFSSESDEESAARSPALRQKKRRQYQSQASIGARIKLLASDPSVSYASSDGERFKGEKKNAAADRRRREAHETQEARAREVIVKMLDDIKATAMRLGKPGAPDGAQVLLGMVGSPNVGKSSVINALRGEKAVSTSATAGHTKRLQHIPIDKDLMLCDCPGLIFPVQNLPVYLQVLLGTFSLAQNREPYSVVHFLGYHLPLEKIYHLRPPRGSGPEDPWCGYSFCESFAEKSGFYITRGRGIPDSYRGGQVLLKEAVTGVLLMFFLPPDSEGFALPPVVDSESLPLAYGPGEAEDDDDDDGEWARDGGSSTGEEEGIAGAVDDTSDEASSDGEKSTKGAVAGGGAEKGKGKKKKVSLVVPSGAEEEEDGAEAEAEAEAAREEARRCKGRHVVKKAGKKMKQGSAADGGSSGGELDEHMKLHLAQKALAKQQKRNKRLGKKGKGNPSGASDSDDAPTRKKGGGGLVAELEGLGLDSQDTQAASTSGGKRGKKRR